MVLKALSAALIRGQHGPRIGFINCEPGSRTDKEARANLRLIGAAPTMLEVLQSSVEILDVAIESREEMIGEKDDVMRDLLAQVLAAIALATPVLAKEE